MTKRFFSAMPVAVLLLLSCKKENAGNPPAPDPFPTMQYFNLHDSAIEQGKPLTVIDVDGDQKGDLRFGVTLIADPVQQHDTRLFKISSSVNTKLLVSPDGISPVLNAGDLIPLSNVGVYEWLVSSSVALVQRVEKINGDISWEGNWKNAVKKYQAFQLIKNNERCNGWIELSVDTTNGKIILHRLAVTREPEKNIKAG